jgi:hypothetical protein
LTATFIHQQTVIRVKETGDDKMSHQIPELCSYAFETKAIHAGQSPGQWTHREVIPPISMSTTYKQPSPAQPVSFEYSRSGNPSRQALETNLAALEGARFGKTSDLIQGQPHPNSPVNNSFDFQLRISSDPDPDSGSVKNW